MSALLTDYYSVVQNAIIVYEGILNQIYLKSLQIAEPDFDPSIDWANILFRLQNTINNLYNIKAVHKFQRVSQEQMQSLFAAYINNESPGKIIVGFTHTLRSFDTLRSLEVQYGVPWQNILAYNNITASQFATQETINIPVPIDLSLRASNNIAVFGDQTNEAILGADFPNDIQEDSTGDFKVLTPSETIKQGVQNLSTAQQGDLPFYESWGLNLILAEEVPSDTVESFLQLRILEGFSIDPRIDTVEVLETVKQGNTITISVQIKPIQGDNFNVAIPTPLTI